MSVTTVAAQAPVSSLVRGLTRRIPGRRAQRAGRHHREDGWRVYLIQTKTGQVGPMLDPVDGSWEVVLNATETVSAQVRKADLAGIDRAWYTPWWGGLLFTWSRGGVETPVVAGPITKWSGETRDGITLEGSGLRAVLANLVVGTDLSVANVSLGHIMWLLVARAQIKPGGGLPVVDGSPDPDGRGHLRNYRVWDLANGQIDKRMTELSEVQNGPDVMLRPQWTDDSRRFIEWAVMHGTSASPAIHSDTVHDFDTTAARSPVVSLSVTTDAQALVSRVWATGSGEGEGTLITRAENLSLVEAGFPFMETVVSRSSVTADENQGTGKATRVFPVALSLPNGQVNAPTKATVRIPLCLKTNVKRWRLHIENRNPHLADGSPRTSLVKFGDLYMGANWNNGGMGSPEKVVDIFDISDGSSETVTGWVEDKQIDGNIVFSFDYETTQAPHALFGGGWVRKDVRDAGRQGYLGMRKTTAIPFRCWLEVEVEGGTQAVAMLGSSSASGFGANLPLFDSPLSWFARDNGVIPVHYATPGDTLANWTNPDSYKWRTYPGMDKADFLLMYMGSNDLFQGASLATVQGRFDTVADLAVRRLGEQIHAVTIPPRTNATGANEARRRLFNQWLPNANLVRQVWDFAGSISDDDETIRPEYDSDGMHLNTAGYRKNAEALLGLVPVKDDNPIGMRLQSRELTELAEGELAARVDAIDQITVGVRADDPTHGVDQFFVGDPAVVTVEGWLAVPDGTHRTRIIKASGTLGDDLTIDFQTESWV